MGGPNHSPLTCEDEAGLEEMVPWLSNSISDTLHRRSAASVIFPSILQPICSNRDVTVVALI